LIKPRAIVSLTAPKVGIREASTSEILVHYLAGRFLPPSIVRKYGLLDEGEHFPYNGSSMISTIGSLLPLI